jgi:hypothetical protein
MTKRDETIILDTPQSIQAFALLQLYFKLKMEAEHPGGPKWRVPPMKAVISVLEANDIQVEKRTKVAVLAQYKALLIAGGILTEPQESA